MKIVPTQEGHRICKKAKFTGVVWYDSQETENVFIYCFCGIVIKDKFLF